MNLNSSPKEVANKAFNRKEHYATIALNPKVIELPRKNLEHLAEWFAMKYPKKT